MALSIRPANLADIASIQRIAAAVWPVAYRDILSPDQLGYMLELFYSEEALAEQMQEKEHQFFVALESDGAAVGFASYSVSGEIAHLHKLYVLPQTQGSGAGASLLHRCETEAMLESATRMQLNVNRHNRARTFYEHHGYCCIFEEDVSIGAGYFMNDYRMEKALHPSAGV